MSEEKQDVMTLDEAFSSEEIEYSPDLTGQESAPDEPVETDDLDKVETEETEPGERDDNVPEEGEGDPADTESGSNETSEKTWEDLGLPKFEGKTREEIANEIQWNNRRRGEQANELGQLRKEVAELKAAIPEKPKAEPKPIEDRLGGMTVDQMEEFNDLYDKNPVAAILKYGEAPIQDIIDQRVRDALEAGMPDSINNIISEKTGAMEYSNFLATTPDAESYEPAMKILDSQENLGKQKRPYVELYELSRLGRAKDPLYEPVYQLCKKHPTMTFDEAKQIAVQISGSSGATKATAAKIEKTINKIDAANTTAKSKKADSISIHNNVDDAFNSIQDE